MVTDNMRIQINMLKSVIGEFAVVSFCGKKNKLYGTLVGMNDVLIELRAEELDYQIRIDTIKSIRYNSEVFCPRHTKSLDEHQKYGNILLKVSLGDYSINSLETKDCVCKGSTSIGWDIPLSLLRGNES